jgi:hypothetical protein
MPSQFRYHGGLAVRPAGVSDRITLLTAPFHMHLPQIALSRVGLQRVLI